MGNYSRLFEPIKIGNVEIKNRIAMAAMGMTGMSTLEGGFSSRIANYYVERARGGTGLIITGLVKVENEIEKMQPGGTPMPLLNPRHFITTTSEMTERIHCYGSKIFLQLTLGWGRVLPRVLDKPPVAPSPIPNYWDPSITCRELTTEEVETMVQKTALSASIAAQAGFDGVEIHAVHEGYLLDQFTMPFFNKRTDKYGGDFEGRMRLPIELVQAIKKTVGQNFPVSLRYSVKSFIKDWNQGGLPGEDFVEKGRDMPEGLKVAQVLEKAGYDAFTADAGSYDAWYWAHPPGYQEPGCYLPFTEQLKQVVNVPVIVAGRLERPEVAIKALEDNKADMVALGRGLLVDPSWPKKVMDGTIEKIKPCLGCHSCLNRLAQGRVVSCAVNPACCREAEYTITPADKKKNVVIVGGGIAGMEAARIAALRGHTVRLFEKTGRLGGHLIEASVPNFKHDERRLLDWYIRELADLKVEINLNTLVSKESLLKMNADEIIIATGSKTFIPKIPGISNEKVGTATDYLLGRKNAGVKVVVVGGGLSGCETALWLKQQNKQVTLIEMLPELMGGVDPVPHPNKTMLLDMLNFNGVTALTNTRLHKITNEGVEVIHSNLREKVIPADSIVISVGMQSDQELFREMGARSNIYLIGDSRDPKNILNAIWNAYEVTRTI